MDVIGDVRSRMTEGLRDDDLNELRDPEPDRGFHWPV